MPLPVRLPILRTRGVNCADQRMGDCTQFKQMFKATVKKSLGLSVYSKCFLYHGLVLQALDFFFFCVPGFLLFHAVSK